MKVLNISTHDYANFAHDNANALRSVGVHCVDLKTEPHVFHYKNQSKLIHLSEAGKYMRQFDVIQIFHSDIRLLQHAKGLGKRIIVYHTGSGYRSNHKALNQAFNPYVERAVIALCEFEGLGAKNETYICGSISHRNVRIKPTIKPLIVSHYPSNAVIKGTEKINELIPQCTGKFEYRHSTYLTDHESQMHRMSECDVYIELYKPEINGNEYGSWGITALEAASMGKIVVTQNLHNEYYESVYGHCPLVLVKDEQDFIKKVSEIVSLSPARIDELKKQTRQWFIDNHSYRATGEMLIQML